MISLAELKLAIKHALDAADTTEDALLAEYEEAAVAYVERETGRYFGPAVDRTEYLVAHGQREVWLSDAPTGAVTATLDGTAVAAADFETRARRLRHTAGWGVLTAFGPGDLVVSYTAGYVAGAEPADIRQAVRELVAKMYEFRTPVVTGTIVAEVPQGVRDTLLHWKRWTA